MPPDTRPRLAVTCPLPDPVAREVLSRYQATFLPRDPTLRPDDVRAAFATHDGVLCAVGDRIDGCALEVRPMRARILANFGVGVDHIDLAAAKAAGLTVTNTPGVLTDATADLTMALLLMTVRRLGEGERLVRAGRWTGWTPTNQLGREVSALTLGIVGMGRIGRAVARRAVHGFGMTVRYWNPRQVPDRPDDRLVGEAAASLENLLGEVDVVSLHCPATSETVHLIDRTRLAAMRRGSWLINTARGEVVDTHALADALRAGHLAGAGLDVFEGEPEPPAVLLPLEQVVLLPHVGSATMETRVAMGRKALANLDAFFCGDRVPDPVA